MDKVPGHTQSIVMRPRATWPKTRRVMPDTAQ